MEQTRKHLKISSIVVLIFAGITLLQIVSELLWGDINTAVLPEGVDRSILVLTKAVLFGISLILTIPSVYVGIKGLKVAKKPDSSKAHIIWAVILFIITVITLISPVLNLFKEGGMKESATAVLSILVEATVYFDYIKYAIAVSKEN